MQAVLASSGEELASNILRLCRDETQREGVLAADGHHVLTGLLHAGLHAGQGCKTAEHAVGALVNLSFLEKARMPIVQAGAVALIVALLRTAPKASNEIVLTNAAKLVGNLAQTYAGIDSLQKAGAIVPLVSLLGAAPVIADAAANALCNLSYDPEAKKDVYHAEIREAGAIPALVALLDGETAYNAVCALCNLASDAAGTAAIRSAGAIVPLVALLQAAKVETAERAAAALFNMALEDQQSDPAILAALAARPPLRRPAMTGQTSPICSKSCSRPPPSASMQPRRATTLLRCSRPSTRRRPCAWPTPSCSARARSWRPCASGASGARRSASTSSRRRTSSCARSRTR